MDLTRALHLASQNRLRGDSGRARKGKARLVLASFIGTILCLGLTPIAHAPNASALGLSAKDYAKIKLQNRQEYKCLLKLWTLESNWRPNAYNKLGGAYGIPQIKNPILKSMNKYEQVDIGIKYLDHRYSSICSALKLWNKRAGYDWVGGWY